jgi:CheY-like chemotaxis protein
MASKDMANYAVYVHSLKSDAKYFGFTKLAEIAYEHELKSKAGDTYYVYENLNDLVAVVNETITTVKEYLSDEEPQEKKQTPVGEQYQTKTILIVDDSNIIRNFAKRIFDGQYSVGTAKDGQEAIDILEKNNSVASIKGTDKIVGMFLDLNMPVVDGFGVLDYMSSKNLLSKMPVIIISGDYDQITKDRAYLYPIADMLEKPFNVQVVKHRIKNFIKLYKSNVFVRCSFNLVLSAASALVAGGLVLP